MRKLAPMCCIGLACRVMPPWPEDSGLSGAAALLGLTEPGPHGVREPEVKQPMPRPALLIRRQG